MALNVEHQTSFSCLVAAINLVLNEEKKEQHLPGNHSLRHDRIVSTISTYMNRLRAPDNQKHFGK